MKWKIIWLNTMTVLLSLTLVTGGFFALVNIKEVNNVKEILRSYNNIVKNLDYSDKSLLEEFKINDTNVRFTIVDRDGKVIQDSYNNVLENHSNRKEIIEAFENGEGIVVRESDTQNSQLVYVATKINDNYVLRSSLPVKDIKVFYGKYIWHYLSVIIMVMFITIILSMRLIKSILYPIKELQEATSKIASGDFSRRAKVTGKNEISSLAETFNYMADELKIKIEDSQDKKNKLECILESMDSGVIAIDNKEYILLINPYAKKIFGIHGNVIGDHISNYIYDKRIIDFMTNIPALNNMELTVTEPVEKVLKFKKAPIIQEVSYPMGTVIVVSDVTEVKKLEVMRSQFVANVSHELKTPLTSIKGFTETLKFVKDEEKREKFLSIIEDEADRLTGLINDILSLSKIENSSGMKREKFEVESIILNAIRMVENQAKNNNIEIITDLRYKEYIEGDRDKFYQIILNLIENAVKYSGNNTTVNVRIYKENNECILEVEDNGIGIPAEDLPRIFERFYRVDKARGSTGINGTGLGLSIVKHLVKMFDGDIEVNSVEGQGTIFRAKFGLKGN